MTAIAKTERPILMTPDNAQKCHDGRKTQTRRIVKPQPDEAGSIFNFREMVEQPGTWLYNGQTFQCPYGLVGDRLWVREAWCCGRPALPSGRGLFPYYGPIETGPRPKGMVVRYKGHWGPIDPPKWRSSLHMPRWACRTVLEITGLRVERVQTISDADAKAEGVTIRPDAEIAARVAAGGETAARMEFWALWKSIHGSGSWAANPWVWVIEFQRVEAP